MENQTLVLQELCKSINNLAMVASIGTFAICAALWCINSAINNLTKIMLNKGKE